jgi:hypothetical protein
MESFDYEDYAVTLKKFFRLLPELRVHAETLKIEDLVVMKKYFDYQRIINQRISKDINAILFKKTSEEFLENKKTANLNKIDI